LNSHITSLWFWYILGSSLYMLKRGWYLVKGPNPVANNFIQFIQVAGVALLFRFGVESAIYWACFTPQLLASGLSYLGWDKFSTTVAVITQFGPCAFGFGLCADVLCDWGIGTVVSKLPLFKDWWPQMPPPLPQVAVVQAEVVETKRTALETTTTVVQKKES
jgi:hypothetical protein